ncbi:HAMP domain-containing protein [bacterium]|nr:HAMP domain-containing protein [bacterium]
MIKINDFKMKPKLIVSFLVVGLVPLLFLGFWSVNLAEKALYKTAFNQLISVRDIKKSQIETFFSERKGDAKVLANNPFTVEAFKELDAAFDKAGGIASGKFKGLTKEKFNAPQSYIKAHDKYFPVFKQYMEEYGYYDVFLIDAEHGMTSFTVTKEGDFAQNVSEIESSLKEVWQKAVKEGKVAISDTEPYAPSGGVPAQFVAAPIEENGKVIGVVALQISLKAINKIMKERAGMGKTGESYLIGQDLLMRSDSFLDPDNHSVNASFKNPSKGKVDTEASKSATAGKTGSGIIIDYNGNPVLSAYTSLNLGDFTWFILSEIDEAEIADPIKQLIISIAIAAAIIAILIVLIAIYMAIQIAAPLQKGVVFAELVAKGDLTAELKINRKDEIGILSDALNAMSANLQEIVKDLTENSSTLSSSSEELSAVSSQMASSAEEMSSQSEMIASASEQVTASVGTVASAAEQASSSVSNIASMTEEMSSTFRNVADSSQKTATKVNQMADAAKEISGGITNVAAAVEEMSSSLNEVAKNTSQASQISKKASSQSDDINERMNNLVTASKQIGKIVGVIKDIADQTNMLALNATIEAAGAGEAGKGFAVVAGEVKELAKQSAEATDEIAGQIEQIQKTTNDAVNGILEIGKIITEIASINENNASAVEEQTATAGEISRTIAGNAASIAQVAISATETSKLVEEIANSTNEASKTAGEVAKHVDELSKGVREVASSSSEAAKGVQEIAMNIQAINEAAKQTATGASQTNVSSMDLSKMAQQLNGLVSKFKL